MKFRYVILVFGFCFMFEIIKCQTDQEWKDFKTKYRKNYKDFTTEKIKRKNWEQNNAFIKKHNLEAAAGKYSFSMAHNEYSDWSPEERKRLRGSTVTPAIAEELRILRQKGIKHTFKPNPPTSLDWRSTLCIPAVKNQENCGSCWAFAAITPLEFQFCMKEGRYLSDNYLPFSEQQLVDCGGQYGTNGCNGGWPVKAWNYVNASSSLHSTYTYPYTAVVDSCKANYYANGKGIKLLSSGPLLIKDEEDLKSGVYTYGPIAVVIHSALESFQYYNSGIYEDSLCSSNGSIGDHAVVIVGYGSEKGNNYWIVRNSWGSTWGENGYMKIKRGNNQCNIATWPLFVQI